MPKKGPQGIHIILLELIFNKHRISFSKHRNSLNEHRWLPIAHSMPIEADAMLIDSNLYQFILTYSNLYKCEAIVIDF